MAQNEATQVVIRFCKRIFGSFVLRPLQRWNAQNRAIDLVEKAERNGLPPVIPPAHNATKEYLESLLKQHPEIADEVAKPPSQVIEGSKQIKVNVEVIGAESNVQAETPPGGSRPLPVATRKISFGLDAEPAVIPQGKVTVSMATDIIRGNFAHPEDYPIEGLADHYGLPVEDVEALVDYYKPFHVIQKQPDSEEKPLLTRENIKRALLLDTYRTALAHEKLELQEKQQKEGKMFIPDKNLGDNLLKTPEYIEENAKWIQDEDERWGRKKVKQLPESPLHPQLVEPEDDPQLKAKIDAAQIVAGTQVTSINESDEFKRKMEKKLQFQPRTKPPVQQIDEPPKIKN